MSTAPRVQVRRVQDEAQEDDGQRILVDRVWPRGVSKDKARLDLWCKEVAPSTELRRWYQHDPDKWQEFARRYRDELQDAERRPPTTTCASGPPGGASPCSRRPGATTSARPRCWPTC